jgi:hypothetical protein
VSGVNRQKIDVTSFVEIPIKMADGKTGKVRLFRRPVLVLSGIEHNNLFLRYDFIQEEGIVIDGTFNTTYLAQQRSKGGNTWRAASWCCLGRTTILPKTIMHAVMGTCTKARDRVPEGAVGLCSVIDGSVLGIYDSATTVD